jgi:hypothetical protein
LRIESVARYNARGDEVLRVRDPRLLPIDAPLRRRDHFFSLLLG